MTTTGKARDDDTPYAKVPAIAAIFWIVKVITTALGEAVSDSFASVPYLIPVILVVFVVAFRRQLRSPHYQAIPYWTTVAGIAVFGTAAADLVTVLLAYLISGGDFQALLPVLLVTLGYAAATALVLRRWYRSEGTLSVHSITTRRRQKFYWWTVTCTFAMGTALGDLTAGPLHVGFLGSSVLFGVAILVPWILHRRGYLNSIAAFWSAYVLTRPLGASVADWLDKPVHDTGTGGGGVDLGAGPVALGGFILFVALIAYLVIKRPDVQEPFEGTEPASASSLTGTTRG
ncbi:MAG: hypothetical protein JF597_28485 [Streptomyces sp.]|uniref:COG4705 family protein n=1 Tax=Streptomyces sp. TaxID=1931 RepID=UPI0025FCFBF9|nr:hypothetical protein [Streptomyces sp.]MBW8797390.1 hypothetical protein [Streptomyces sp.]